MIWWVEEVLPEQGEVLCMFYIQADGRGVLTNHFLLTLYTHLLVG